MRSPVAQQPHLRMQQLHHRLGVAGADGRHQTVQQHPVGRARNGGLRIAAKSPSGPAGQLPARLLGAPDRLGYARVGLTEHVGQQEHDPLGRL